MNVEKDDLRLMLISMFRYSLGRRTNMSMEATRCIRAYHAGALSPTDLASMAESIDDRIVAYGVEEGLGSDVDAKEWRLFRAWCLEQSAPRDQRSACPTCRQENETSQVEELGATTTLLGFFAHYDENGVRHSHDPNKITIAYRCTRGHAWQVDGLRPCPSAGCSYGKEGKA